MPDVETLTGIRVTLSPLFGDSDSPIGRVRTEVPGVWRVDAFHEAFPNGMLHIGMIGRQDGANFCENHQYGGFTPEQKSDMLLQIRQLHGHASLDAPVELPDAIGEIESYQEIEDDEDDEDDTELE